MRGEPREIEVKAEDPRTLEYDRDVRIELHHNSHQSTSLKLSELEAADLLLKLEIELDRRRGL
jgi:hypothetical protein